MGSAERYRGELAAIIALVIGLFFGWMLPDGSAYLVIGILGMLFGRFLWKKQHTLQKYLMIGGLFAGFAFSTNTYVLALLVAYGVGIFFGYYFHQQNIVAP